MIRGSANHNGYPSKAHQSLLGLMAMYVLARADRVHVPSSGSVAGPRFAVDSSGVRIRRCLQGTDAQVIKQGTLRSGRVSITQNAQYC